MGCSLGMMARTYWQTLKLVKLSLITISAMMAVGFTTRYSGLDATLGLAFAQTGFLYPFFGTMLGWLGVALTGSDTSSNVLFGSLQKITAEQLGLSPVLMAAANSSGGVMGKMIDAQSIVVASTATRWYGHEGDILRYVFVHSVVLACLVGGLVMTHGDDNGLVCPPRLAQRQVVIVPIWKSDAERGQVLEASERIRDELRAAGIRPHVDARDGMKPGAKYYEWEARGVPLRLELGPIRPMRG